MVNVRRPAVVEPLTDADLQRYEVEARRILETTPESSDADQMRRDLAGALLEIVVKIRDLRDPRPDPAAASFERRIRALEGEVGKHEKF